MLRSFIFISMFFYAYNGYAQKGKISAEYAYGLNVPTGNFRDVNIQNNSAGFAKTGIASHLALSYQFTEKGLSALFSMDNQANALDAAGYDRELTLLYPGTNWSISSEAYTMGGYYLGLKQGFRVNDKITLDLLGQLGLAFAKQPAMSEMEFNSGIWFVSSSNYSAAFAYKLGGQLKYEFFERSHLFLDVNFIGSRHKFNKSEVFSSDGDYNLYNTSMNFNSISFKLGLAVDLYK